MGRLQGKVAFITGSGSGIARAAAQLFALEGASVAIAELKPPLTTMKTDTDDDSFTDTASDDETRSWMDLPGVEEIGEGSCGEHECDPRKIEMAVQPSMIDSVRKQIPSSKNGFSVVLVPSR